MIITDRIPLKPNNKQKTLFKKHSGYARVVYNWGVDECKRARHNREPRATKAFRLMTTFNTVKDVLFPWNRELSQNPSKNALKDVSRAWETYWNNRDRKKRNPPYRYRSRKSNMSFGIDDGPKKVRTKNKKVRFPKIGWIRMNREPRFLGDVKTCKVKLINSIWHVYLTYEISDPLEKFEGNILGIDVGLRTLSTTYNGINSEKFDTNENKLYSDKIRKLDRAISRSRKIFGYKNSSKRREKLYNIKRKMYWKEENRKKENYTIIAKAITKQAKMLVLETLNINYMRRYRRLSKSFHKKAIGKFLSILKWQALKQGVRISYVDKFFPSSRLCSSCGRKNTELGLEAEWECLSCGVVHDRDVNAAINLYRQGLAVS